MTENEWVFSKGENNHDLVIQNYRILLILFPNVGGHVIQPLKRLKRFNKHHPLRNSGCCIYEMHGDEKWKEGPERARK